MVLQDIKNFPHIHDSLNKANEKQSCDHRFKNVCDVHKASGQYIQIWRQQIQGNRLPLPIVDDAHITCFNKEQKVANNDEIKAAKESEKVQKVVDGAQFVNLIFLMERTHIQIVIIST